MSSFLRREDHVCSDGCIVRLNLMQVQALTEAWNRNGLFLQGPMGSGKTLVSLLLPTIFGAKRALLIVPGGSIQEKTVADWKQLREHWRILPLNPTLGVPSSPAITVVTYQFLSVEQNADFIEQFQPDLLIFDESHWMKSNKSAVHRRVKRFRELYPDVPICLMSGTPAKRSINDFAPSMYWALGNFCPLPIPPHASDLRDWSLCVDAAVKDYNRLSPGALNVFGENIPDIRRGIRNRIFSTPGCIASDRVAVDSELVIHLRNLPLSRAEDAPYEALYEDRELPDGTTFTDAVELWRHARELGMGFWRRANPPPPKWWSEPRKMWHAGVRRVLSASRTIDTAKQVASAVDRNTKHPLYDILQNWRAVENKFDLKTEAVWVGETALLYAANWLKDGGIAWVEHTPFGERLSALTGIPYFGEDGRTADGRHSIVTYQGKTMIASWHANGTGHNLQRYDRGLLTSMWPTATWWEQTLARQHRPGQKSPQVLFDIPISCREQLAGFERARNEDAPFHKDLLAIPSRLVDCTFYSDKITQRGFAWTTAE